MFENVNLYEGVRLTLALIGFIVCAWGALRVSDGITAFATPIRGRKLHQRRGLMLIGLAINLVIFGQAALAGTIPEPSVQTTQTITGSIAYIMILLLVLGAACWQIDSWSGLEDVLAGQPLSLTPGERYDEVVWSGRQMAHLINDRLQEIMGTLELTAEEGSLTEADRAAIQTTIDRITDMAQEIKGLHENIKGLSSVTSLIGGAGGEAETSSHQP